MIPVSSCDANNPIEPEPEQEGQITVTSIFPEGGVIGATITINGANFSPVASNNKVRINGVLAEVRSGTATSLRVRIPEGATTGEISVSHRDFTVTGPVFTVIESLGSQKMSMNINGNNLKIPYLSNYALDEANADISSAVIVVHGNKRNAGAYFGNMMAAASLRPEKTASTIIVAPQFITESEIEELSLDEEHLYWSSGGWKSGSRSRNETSNPRPERISSYAALDTLVMRLAHNFPNLTSMVITGHSAGGQFVNRYSGCSPVFHALKNQFQIHAKFIVANPSSYFYLDNRRLVDGTVDAFEVPTTSCNDYNEWKYGLENLYTYQSAVGADSIRNMLKSREVVYLVGENDNDPQSSSLDRSCEGMLQGRHRLERGLVYFNYLKAYYGEDILRLHSFDIVPDAGHNSLAIYSSTIGLGHLFE